MRVLHEPELAGLMTGPSRPGPTFAVHGPDDPAREPAERFIADGFERCFGARVDSFMPHLVTLCRDGEILAAAGYRQAFEPLFLETYLDEPVERSLERSAGSAVRRTAIAELGQLATRAPRYLTPLINRVSSHLVREGVSWVAITATRELRRVFERLSLDAIPIAAADPARPGIDSIRWGEYYEHDPWVIAGPLPTQHARSGPKRRAGGS